MPSARRFPPPWSVDEYNNACFIGKDATGQALGYFYFEAKPGRCSTKVRSASSGRIIWRYKGETTPAEIKQATDARRNAKLGEFDHER